MTNRLRIHALIFLLAAGCSACAQQKVVALDYFFNRETRKSAGGETQRFHYTWEDTTASGYSKFGACFRAEGARLSSLETAPTAENLKGASVYIIVDPDTPRESPAPNYITPEAIRAIKDWVSRGGTLLLFGNDSLNVEFNHFNALAGAFGVRFNSGLYHTVPNDKFELGGFRIPEGHPVFKTARYIYMKEIATLTVASPAKADLLENGNAIIATAVVGKGKVLIVGDPWIYNEYCNGRLPARYGFENDKAAADLARWSLGK